jgi:hypothetical protein
MEELTTIIPLIYILLTTTKSVHQARAVPARGLLHLCELSTPSGSMVFQNILHLQQHVLTELLLRE